MRNLFFVLSCAAIACLVSACSTFGVDMTRYNLNLDAAAALAAPDRAIVFTEFAKADMFGMADPMVYAEIKDKPTDAGSRTATLLTHDIKYVGVWPGSYALSSVQLPAKSVYYTFPGWKSGPDRAIGVFDVRAGDVIYIGKLVFKAQGATMEMAVEDNFEDFKRGLPKDLAARVQKRLVTLPPTFTFASQRRVAY